MTREMGGGEGGFLFELLQSDEAASEEESVRSPDKGAVQTPISALWLSMSATPNRTTEKLVTTKFTEIW